jgi:hypothetical protein
MLISKEHFSIKEWRAGNGGPLFFKKIKLYKETLLFDEKI